MVGFVENAETALPFLWNRHSADPGAWHFLNDWTYGRRPIADCENNMAADIKRIAEIIAAEIGARPEQAAAAIGLLDEGSTVPFIARYRKEATGGLDDTQLRLLAERLIYVRELDARRATIVESIRSQDKLTEDLAAKIAAITTKAELEDIYLPYKPKRRTRAEIARERGLGRWRMPFWPIVPPFPLNWRNPI